MRVACSFVQIYNEQLLDLLAPGPLADERNRSRASYDEKKLPRS